MMNMKRVSLAGVGDILLERSTRAKYINLSVKPFRGVRVAVPRGVSFKEAEAVAQSKAQWLKAHLARMIVIERQILERKKNPPIDPLPARRLLVERLAHLAALHGFSYNKVFVRRQKTRWGSCSHQNNINLNINLVRLPAALIDYTLLHELVHTRIKNHGPDFWAELGRYISDSKRLDREMNRYWMFLLDDF
jgi:predicted metal-dependent hydrolase